MTSLEDCADAENLFCQTQKTVCSHLLQDPYSYQVVDDPINALKRVQNNRRVNQQKKEAITIGRQHLDGKTQSKGFARVKVEKHGLSDRDEILEEDDNSADDPSSDIGYESPTIIAKPKLKPTRRKQGKRSRNSLLDDDADYGMKSPRASKKTKHESKSQYKVAGEKGDNNRYLVYDSNDPAYRTYLSDIHSLSTCRLASR